MDEARWKQRHDNFRNALDRLSQACAKRDYSDLERAGLVQIFQFTFELSWKSLKDLLFYSGFVRTTPRGVIRASFEAGFIDEDDCETLLDALEKRNRLCHIYLEEVAVEAEALIRDRYHPSLIRICASLEDRR